MITRTLLQNMFNDAVKLLAIVDRLYQAKNDEKLKTITKDLIRGIRKIIIANELSGNNIACITGMQGVGKTTLFKNLYALDEDQVNITIGRGEKLPILVKEDMSDAEEIKMYKVSLGNNGVDYGWEKVKEEIDAETFKQLSSGDVDPNVMLLEMRMPKRHFDNEFSAFLLLPGFEAKKDYWRSIIEFSVACSNTCVFVLNGDSNATAMSKQVMKDIDAMFLDNKPIFALSFSDSSEDDNQELKKTIISQHGILESESDRVVPVGDYGSAEMNLQWIEALKTALDKYLAPISDVSHKQAQYIGDIIRNDINLELNELRTVLNDMNFQQIYRAYEGDVKLNKFKKAERRQRKKIEEALIKELNEMQQISHEYVMEALKGKPYHDGLRQKLFGRSVHDIDLYEKTIKEALSVSRNNKLPKNNDSIIYNSYISVFNASATQIAKEPSVKIESKVKNEVLSDIRYFICSDENNQYDLINSDYTKVLEMIPEFASSYYMNILNNIFDRASEHNHIEDKSVTFEVESLMKSSQQGRNVLLGIFGIAGIDILPDGKLDLLEVIANALGVSVSTVMLGLGAAGAAGIGLKVAQDINKSQVEELYAMRKTIATIYIDYQAGFMKAYDDYMNEIKEKIIDRLEKINNPYRNSGHLINAYNAINRIEATLDNIQDTIHGSNYDSPRLITE